MTGLNNDQIWFDLSKDKMIYVIIKEFIYYHSDGQIRWLLQGVSKYNDLK